MSRHAEIKASYKALESGFANMYVPKSFFTPLFETKESLRARLKNSIPKLKSQMSMPKASSGAESENTMKPDYKNWMPKGMIYTGLAIAALSLILFIVFGLTGIVSGALKTVLSTVFLIITVFGAAVTLWMFLLYRAFDYNGKRQMSRRIIEGVAEYVKIPDGGKCLDVGCGSGALTIAVAKRNPKAGVIGIDRWGKEYASYNKPLCERNAKAEGVSNTSFQKGDATKLGFADETFDAVTSNYVYHNIPGDRQSYLLETLRTLKKGGTFALHDIFSRSRYGDMQAFVRKLKDMGYEKVELIDTTDKYMKKHEAVWMELSGSALLAGKK